MYICPMEEFEFVQRVGFSKNYFSVEIASLHEMMLTILIMCSLSKIKTYHPCLVFQFSAFYLSVRFQKQGSVCILAKRPYPGGIIGKLVNITSY